MFRARQQMMPSASCDVVFERLQANERGELDLVLVNDSQLVLPDVETTDVRALLDAGIDLRQVNTKILAGNQVVTDLSVEQPQDSIQDKEK